MREWLRWWWRSWFWTTDEAERYFNDVQDDVDS